MKTLTLQSFFLLLVLGASVVGCGAQSVSAVATPTAAPTNTAEMKPAPLPTPTRGPEMSDPRFEPLIVQARADLATRLGVRPEVIDLKKAETVQWSDSSLGCPQPGYFYAQVITPGFLIVLDSGGKEYSYHSDGTRIFLCEKK